MLRRLPPLGAVLLFIAACSGKATTTNALGGVGGPVTIASGLQGLPNAMASDGTTLQHPSPGGSHLDLDETGVSHHPRLCLALAVLPIAARRRSGRVEKKPMQDAAAIDGERVTADGKLHLVSKVFAELR